MINYFKHNNDPSLKINTLTQFLEDGNCIYQIIGKAERDQNANTKLYNILRKYINDPTKISMIKKENALNTAKSCPCLNISNKKMYFTSCIFCLSGKKCYNEKSNRTFNLNIKTKTGEKQIKVCYPDVSKCRNRITLGMHIDFSFTYNGRYLDIIDVNPLKQSNTSKFSNKKADSNKKKDNSKIENLKKENFPSLESIDNSIKVINSNKTKKIKSINSDASRIIKNNTELSGSKRFNSESKNESKDECLKKTTVKDILCKNINTDDEDNAKTNDSNLTAPQIILPPELTKKLDFTISHLNKEREILRKNFIDLEKEIIDQYNYFENNLFNRYGRYVNDNDFTYTIS